MVKVEVKGNRAWRVDCMTEQVSSEEAYVVGTFEQVKEVFKEADVRDVEEFMYFVKAVEQDAELEQTVYPACVRSSDIIHLSETHLYIRDHSNQLHIHMIQQRHSRTH